MSARPSLHCHSRAGGEPALHNQRAKRLHFTSTQPPPSSPRRRGPSASHPAREALQYQAPPYWHRALHFALSPAHALARREGLLDRWRAKNAYGALVAYADVPFESCINLSPPSLSASISAICGPVDHERHPRQHRPAPPQDPQTRPRNRRKACRLLLLFVLQRLHLPIAPIRINEVVGRVGQ